ncbi:MAG: T9SS C-terminal target domain-containing protein [Ignavibacteriales bacterium]|nr:MAG: T9SS C-terminal target domain-containing protein [Ignavibacteriales bacterium]
MKRNNFSLPEPVSGSFTFRNKMLSKGLLSEKQLQHDILKNKSTFLIISIFILFLTVPSLAQNSQINWYSFSSGFNTSATVNTTSISSVGESFGGKISNGSSSIITGFLSYQANGSIIGGVIPNLPIPIGTGSAEVWGDSIYYFGGSSNWTGTIIYQRIYKFDGVSWSYYDSIPDYSLWGIETILVDNNVYLLGGYPSGTSLNRKYNLTTKEWSNLTESPNVSQAYGLTSEYYNGKIFLFNNEGRVFAYDIAGDSWETKTPNSVSGSYPNLRSVLYNGEIYIVGLGGLGVPGFYKYTPSTDQWTKLEDSPYPVYACEMGIINGLIYCVGGNNNTYALYKSAAIYNTTTNSWTVDSISISSNRDWMASVKYRGSFYVIGGLGATSFAVNIVEEIIPHGTVDIDDEEELVPTEYKLQQNYPNPFNPGTIISWQLPVGSLVLLKIYDILGREVATLVNEIKGAGYYKVNFDGSSLASGIYIYRLTAGNYISTKKMLMIK